MEGITESALSVRVHAVNAKLASMISRMREALAGRQNFQPEDVRELSEPVAEMEPILAEAKRLRTLQPDLDGELEAYTGNLGEAQKALEQLRFMLLARRANLDAMRSHIETVGYWAAAYRQTR
jgi:hypothetical protein